MKNKLPLRLLYWANGISGFAQGISMLAIPWYFANKQHSNYFNVAYGIITLLVLFFGLYAGTLVDRFSRKLNFMVNSLVCGSLLLAIALVGLVNLNLSDFLVIAVFAITMLNYNIHYPTLYAFGQEISDAKEYGKVNAQIEIVGQSTSILSGAIAAVMLDGRVFKVLGISINLGHWPIWEIFLLNAITYFLAATLIYFIPYTPKLINHINQGLLSRVKYGFSYLLSHPKVLLFGLFSYSVFAMLLVEIHAVLPTYVSHHLHAGGAVFAIADGVYAVGALFAGLFIHKAFSGVGVQKAIIFLTLVTVGIFFWAFASKGIWIIYTISVILGFTNAGIRVLRLTYLFNTIPNELMGRVNSIFNMANVLTRSLFIFIFSMPFFTFDNNIIYAYLIMALFLAVSAGIMWVGLFKNKVAH